MSGAVWARYQALLKVSPANPRLKSPSRSGGASSTMHCLSPETAGPLQKVVATRSEAINQRTRHQTHAVMRLARGDDKAVASFKCFFPVAEDEPEVPAFDIGRLDMGMRMQCPNGTGRGKAERHNHKVWMIRQHLTRDDFACRHNWKSRRCSALSAHEKRMPPFRSMLVPVIKALSSQARNSTRLAASSTCP